MVAAYRFKPVVVVSLLVLLLLAILLSLALGPVAIPLGDTLRVLLQRFTEADLPADQVLIIELGSTVLAQLPAAVLPYATVVGAFLGGVATTWLVYRLGQSVQGTSVASMLLAGIAIAAISGAIIGLLSYLADDAMLRTLTFWNMGTLGGASYERVAVLAVCCALHYCSASRRRGIWAWISSGSSASWCCSLRWALAPVLRRQV